MAANPYRDCKVVIDQWGTSEMRYVVYVNDADQPLFRQNMVVDGFALAHEHAHKLASWLSIPVTVTEAARKTRGYLVHAEISEASKRLDNALLRSRGMSKPQPPPSRNSQPAVWDLVVADMKERDQEGRKKYGTPLQPFNGRDVLTDAYQEALDLAVYLRQAIYERDKK